ncbi:tyrosine-type recombinase/integrase [Spelaeicoccus albus]|uniref:tyrosine-type recombinase/integrase n=1 Tax=Spelaeicoccus albus TaxID=1280376 RepID=UPI0015C83BA0
MSRPVIASRNGNFIPPQNFNRLWRQIRTAAGFDWVTGHTFRKTVATVIESNTGLRDSSLQLGHSNEMTTSTYYVARPDIAPDSRGILQGFVEPSR